MEDAGTPEGPGGASGARARILAASTEIMASEGRDALTTRAVAAAAGVQAPTIYRLFGDKDGLLDAVAEQGFATYLAQKGSLEPLADPVADLRSGWDLHIAFGLAHPGIFAIMSGRTRSGYTSPAETAGLAHLQTRIHRLAVAGRLRVAEARAVNLVRAFGWGVVSTLLGQSEGRRDVGLAEAAREAMVAAVTIEPIVLEPSGSKAAAVTLRATLAMTDVYSPGEQLLLRELLDRLTTA